MLLLALVLAVLPVTAAGAAPSDDEVVARGRGWGYLIDKLVTDGVPRAEVVAAFADVRMPPFDGLEFNLDPRESPARYRRLQSPETVRAARQCRARYDAAFTAAETREGVPAGIVASIIQVESSCGLTTGSSTVLHRLARLAMTNDPANLADNIRRHAGEPPDPAIAEQAQRRAAYLEATFYPEVLGAFTMAKQLHIDVLALEGSSAGAFGFPQFLPTSYLRYGVDGDGDGRVSLYTMADAAASCARFLSQNGWRAGLSLAEQRRVIWQYNRSEPYIDTILALHRQIDEPPATTQRAARPRAPRLAKRR